MERLWGDFQSVIQLSVALNAAITALITFARPDVVAEKREVDRLALLPSAWSKPDGGVPVRTSLQLLSGRCERVLRRYDRLQDGWIRSLAIASAVASIGLLVWSSYVYRDPIPGWAAVLAVLQFIPFLAGMLAAVLVALHCRMVIMPERLRLEKLL
jgi:hypothetical protein